MGDAESNGYYSGRIEKMEGGNVYFRLNNKIERHGKFKQDKRTLLIDEVGFYFLLNGAKPNLEVGQKYSISRRRLRLYAGRLTKMKNGQINQKTSAPTLDDEIDVENLELPDMGGTGLQDLMSDQEEKDIVLEDDNK